MLLLKQGILLLLLLAFSSASSLFAQSESSIWSRLGSPPPRITGIVALADTVLISTENGAYSITTTATSWTFQPLVPHGRLLRSGSGEIVAVGANVWVYSTNAGAWRISTNPALAVLSQSLPSVLPTLTQATVRMPDGYDIAVTSGGVAVRQDSVWRKVLDLPFDGTRKIVGLARLGLRLYTATERGVVLGEEITVAKPSPFELLAYKRFAWKPCDDGLATIFSTVQTFARWMTIENSWFSADSGRTWFYRAVDSVRAVTLAPTRDSSILALSASGILRSRNVGVTWSNVGFMLPRGVRWFQDFRTKRILPCIVGTSGTAGNNPNATLTFFAQDTTQQRLRPTHVVESRDGGLTWQMVALSGLPDNVAMSGIVQSPRGFLFASDAAFQRPTLYRSGDGGKTWQTLPVGRVPETLAVHPTTGTLLLSGSPVMRSGDDGLTWMAVEGLPFRTGGRFEGANEFAFSSASTVLLNIRNVGLFRSSDGGRSFGKQKSALPDVYTLRSLPNGDVLALGVDTTSGRARSIAWNSANGGLSWERLENGFPTHQDFLLTGIVAAPNNEALALSSHGIFRLNRSKARTKAALQQISSEQISSEQSASEQLSILPSLLDGERSLSQPLALNLAPNPAQNHVVLSIALSRPMAVTCEIFTRRGELLQTTVHDALPSGSQALALDVRGLPSGQYFCRVQTENTSHATSQVTSFVIIR